MVKYRKSLGMALLTLTGLAIPTVFSWAQTTLNTVPQGYLALNIAAGTGTSPTVSFVSFPLQGAASASGQMTGQVTGITANTITNSNAGWTAGQLSQATTPYLIEFTSGAAAGRSFLISTSTANTATTLTLNASDASQTNLTTLGIVAGTDTYQIIPADTISSLFGTPGSTGVLGGASVTGADQIQLYSPTNGWASYYYNSTSGWLQVGPPIPSGNVVIRPDTGVFYLRYPTTPLTLTLTGQVPSVARQALAANTGVTILSNNWPVNLTLASSNISNIPGWVTGGSASTADQVQVYSPTNGWTAYYNNGTNWVQVGPPINSNNVAISAGSAVILVKRGSTTGYSLLTEALPYSL
ncbi:hypothetical protein [Pseudomonas sp.]|uniref:hypothetical protein n=1 Tax=Pseudomonas sp. TaxID=306 RepID=UPI003C4E44E3